MCVLLMNVCLYGFCYYPSLVVECILANSSPETVFHEVICIMVVTQ